MNREFMTKNKSGSMENSYFVEGIQGAGKSTMVAKLAQENPSYNVYREGDYCPVELAWPGVRFWRKNSIYRYWKNTRISQI